MVTAQADATMTQLLASLSDARQKSDALFETVKTECLYDRPIPERHRIVFYIGHLEAFDWNLLHENVFGLTSFHPKFDQLFAFGIDPVGGGLPTDQPADWPPLHDVRDYVHKIRAALDEKLSSGIVDSSERIQSGFSFETLLNVAIEHRLMHVETLAYMFHQIPLGNKVPQASPIVLAPEPLNPRMIEIPAGRVTLGLQRNTGAFGWDNEFDANSADVPAFAIDQFMVTNRQFLDFMNNGGYQTRSLWSDADWNWINSEAISHPVFWKKSETGWLYRGMFHEIPLPPDWPVYVSHAEASAYARWTGKQLPTEAQWQRAACGTPEGSERYYPWGEDAPSETLGNFDFKSWDPAPVNAAPQGRSAFGVEGMAGNGWEWTSSEFGPFPGFKAFPFYPGYSANFFDGKHFVMKGGSPRTAACMLRPTFRNWFQAHYQYVYAGFRCVAAQ
jgi:gamma-glutamyl hercynylcysteine S-oxide synthase